MDRMTWTEKGAGSSSQQMNLPSEAGVEKGVLFLGQRTAGTKALRQKGDRAHGPEEVTA